MTTRRNFLKQSLLAAGAASVPAGNLLAQEKMEEKRPKYNLPYKNTYLKEPFVTENEFRTARPETITPGTFEEAKQILPDPTWSGHEKEIEMYWKAWQIGIGNIKAPEPDSGFVCSYLDVAYNGNIFMWDSGSPRRTERTGSSVTFRPARDRNSSLGARSSIISSSAIWTAYTRYSPPFALIING